MRRSSFSRCLIAGSLAACLTFAVPLAQAQFRHVTLDGVGTDGLPKKVVLLEPEVVVREISAGGVVEKLPEATRKAVANLQGSLDAHLAKRSEFTVVPRPQLTAEEQVLMDDYAATIYQIGLTAYLKTRQQGAWQVKAKTFDYTVGPGLKFLKEKTGADAALLMVGEDTVSSGGRKAMMVMALLLARVAIAGGASAVLFAYVDLETGNLLWLNADMSGSKDLADPKSAGEMVEAAMGPYPKAGAR